MGSPIKMTLRTGGVQRLLKPGLMYYACIYIYIYKYRLFTKLLCTSARGDDFHSFYNFHQIKGLDVIFLKSYF